jgi:2-dehydro-3-deoxygluconokinase
MMRLSPPWFLCFGQAGSFDLIYGGGEANVAVSLVNFGVAVDHAARLPNNDLGDACIQYLRQYGRGVDKIVRGGDRLAIHIATVAEVEKLIGG